MTWLLRIDLEAPSQNSLGGRNWRTRAAKTKKTRTTWAYMTVIAMGEACVQRATSPRRLHIHAYRKQRCRDIANLIGGMKACVDGMVDAGLLVDDRDTLATITYDQGTCRQSPTGKACTVLTVDEEHVPTDRLTKRQSALEKV